MMLTARGEQMDKERGQRMGAVKYLTKPFSPQKLAEQVIEIIENAAVQKNIGANDHRGVAIVYTALGETDKAIEWIEKSFQKHEESLCSLVVDPKFDSLRNDPGFKTILIKTGLAKD